MSANATDSLTADLKDINLEYVFNIVNFHTVDFGGLATGRAYAANLMAHPRSGRPAPRAGLHLQRRLPGTDERARGMVERENAITLDAHINDPANRSMTRVEGNIRIGAPPKGGIDLTINTENIDLAFLNRYTEGIFSGLNGRASGWTRVFGPFKGINLEGDMLVHEGGMKVISTGVDYHLVNDSVILRPDNIYFHDARVYDRHGRAGKDDHYAVVNGVMRHTHLSNMSYEFDIEARNILGYDIKRFRRRSVLRHSLCHRPYRLQRAGGTAERRHRRPSGKRHGIHLQPGFARHARRRPLHHLQGAARQHRRDNTIAAPGPGRTGN